MGSGDKFTVDIVQWFGLAIGISRFPHNWSITLLIGCISIYIGIGKGYDE